MAYGRPDLDLLHIYAHDRGHKMPTAGALRVLLHRDKIKRRDDGWYDISSVMRHFGWDKDERP